MHLTDQPFKMKDLQRAVFISISLCVQCANGWSFRLDARTNIREQATVFVDRRGVMLAGVCALIIPTAARAAGPDDDAGLFQRTAKDFGYIFRPPIGCDQTKKPLQTHLDEVSFISGDMKGYQFGITVDPVRINSLKEFGTPEEVAARVVTAEVNRDGVFEVTLVSDPMESKDGGYILEYLSDGKRGEKHFITKIFVSNKKLYVLTAQTKENDFTNLKTQAFEAVDSFSISDSK